MLLQLPGLLRQLASMHGFQQPLSRLQEQWALYRRAIAVVASSSEERTGGDKGIDLSIKGGVSNGPGQHRLFCLAEHSHVLQHVVLHRAYTALRTSDQDKLRTSLPSAPLLEGLSRVKGLAFL